MAKYTYQQLQDLWVQAGGSAASSAMAAAIAMAESGGDSDATNSNTNGTTDRGLWQINSIHGSQSTNDPIANARAAVNISQNGTTWRPWCTAWTGPCSGTYMGDTAPYRKFLNGQSADSGGTPATDASILGRIVNPKEWVSAIFKPLSVWLAYGGLATLGVTLIALGVFVLVTKSGSVKDLGAVAVKAATKV